MEIVERTDARGIDTSLSGVSWASIAAGAAVAAATSLLLLALGAGLGLRQSRHGLTPASRRAHSKQAPGSIW